MQVKIFNNERMANQAIVSLYQNMKLPISHLYSNVWAVIVFWLNIQTESMQYTKHIINVNTTQKRSTTSVSAKEEAVAQKK